LKAQYVPSVIKNIEKYLAPFALNGSVITKMLPTAQMSMGIAMCHARSLKREDE
jgi:hypothetical protein